MKSALWICFCTLLAGWVRCHNFDEVFLEGQIYFSDPDCYSRMTRAALVAEHPGTVLRWHRFENFPTGIEAHTTVPLDYAIVGLRAGLNGFLNRMDPGGRSRAQSLDLAGALISPLLAMVGTCFLGIWARRFTTDRGMVAFGFALSPILVHGTLLGRPDHQSLLLVLLAVALVAECTLSAKPNRGWALTSGIAWAGSLWVSLYEPAILLVLIAGAWLIGAPRRLLERERLWWLLAFALIAGTALVIEGWRVAWPDPALRPFLTNWLGSIGELGHPGFGLLFRWLGWGLIATPFLLLHTARKDRRASLILALLVALLGLTFWQARWGYFLALGFILSLPWQLQGISRRWLAWLALILSFWPVAREWEDRLFPTEPLQRLRKENLQEQVFLRAIAGRMAGHGEQPFMAPWWVSPALAYWSGQPGVAGSSHESIAGIVDSARVYTADSWESALPLLRARGVRWLISDDPDRLILNSSGVLGIAAPERPLARLLTEQPHSVGAALKPIYSNDYFKLFLLEETKLSQ